MDGEEETCGTQGDLCGTLRKRQPLLEAILYKDNFNRAYKRVKENKGAPGIDGMTIEEALPYLKEHQRELTNYIYRGKYTPSPVRRSSRMSLWKKRTCGSFYSLSACFCLWK